MTFKYRNHSGETVYEAVAKAITFDNKGQLVRYLKNRYEDSGFVNDNTVIDIEPYGYDRRIDWDTYIVTADGRAVGYTNGAVEDKLWQTPTERHNSDELPYPIHSEKERGDHE